MSARIVCRSASLSLVLVAVYLGLMVTSASVHAVGVTLSVSPNPVDGGTECVAIVSINGLGVLDVGRTPVIYWGDGDRYDYQASDFYSHGINDWGFTARHVYVATNSTVTCQASADLYAGASGGGPYARFQPSTTVTINANDIPTARDDEFVVPQDGERIVFMPSNHGAPYWDILDNDDPIWGLTPAIESYPSHGYMTFGSDGRWTYHTQRGFFGTEEFRYSVTDIQGRKSRIVTARVSVAPPVKVTAPGEVRVEVAPSPLRSGKDSWAAVQVSFGGGLNSLSLGNTPTPGGTTPRIDWGDGSPLQVLESAFYERHGSLSVATLRAWHRYYSVGTFTPTVDLWFYDEAGSPTNHVRAQTTVDVLPGVFPNAQDDSYVAYMDTPLELKDDEGLLANDSDADGDRLFAEQTSTPLHGTVGVGVNGGFMYTPRPGFVGTDHFKYRARTTGNLYSFRDALVTVQVRPLPGHLLCSVLTAGDQAVTNAEVVLFKNEGGTWLPWSTFTPYSGGNWGRPVDQEPGTYRLRAAASGYETEFYDGVDEVLQASDVVIESDHYVNLGMLLVRSDCIAGTVRDAQGMGLAGMSVTGGGRTATTDSSGHYCLGPLETGAYEVVASDPSGAYLDGTGPPVVVPDDWTAHVDRVLVRANRPPTGVNDAYSVEEDQTLDVDAPGLLANDADSDGDSLSAVLQIAPAHGVLSLHSDGSFSYSPTAGCSGPDSFTYVANDGNTDSVPATVSIEVTAVNDAPAADAGGPYEIEADDALSLDASESHDPDGTAEEEGLVYEWDMNADGVFGDATGVAPEVSWSTLRDLRPAVPLNQQVDITLRVTDGGGLSSTATAKLTVNDTTAPEITVPADISEEATGPDGASVTFSVSATDVADGSVAATATPASGSTFHLGETTVNVTADDAVGNTTSRQFTVTVVDTTSPVIRDAPTELPPVEATSAAGAVATWTPPTASDLVDGAVTPIADHSPGVTFPLGTTRVTYTAADARGNSVSASFTVRVRDTTAPVIPAHDNIAVAAAGPGGAVVTWPAIIAGDAVDGSVSVTCTPASGSTFALGATTVTMSTNDAAGNVALPEIFTVTVGYVWSGFFRPVDNAPTFNVAKAGSAIPVKFSLGGDMGLGIFAPGFPRVVPTMEGSTATEDAIEETLPAVTVSGLSYDASSGQYVYVWKTDKKLAGTCQTLQLKLVDGSVHYANFKFTR